MRSSRKRFRSTPRFRWRQKKDFTNVFDEDVERSLQAGMNAHLSKPIEPEKLYETMARLIAHYRQ